MDDNVTKRVCPTSWKPNETMWWVALPDAAGRGWRFEWQGTAQSGDEAVIRAKEAARLALPDSRGRDQMSHLRNEDFEMESCPLDECGGLMQTHELAVSGPLFIKPGSREDRVCDSPVPEGEIRKVTRQAEGMIIKLLALDESVSWALADHHSFSFRWNAAASRDCESGLPRRGVNMDFRDGYESALAISPIIVNAIMRLLFDTRGGRFPWGTYLEVGNGGYRDFLGRMTLPVAEFAAARDRVRRNPERNLGPILWKLHRLGSDELATAIVRIATRLGADTEAGDAVAAAHPSREGHGWRLGELP